MNLYRAIDNNVGTLQHFITHEWHWDSIQYNKILNAIKEEDREVMKIYPYQANVPFLYPLKTSENQRYIEMSKYRNKQYRNGTLSWNGLKQFWKLIKLITSGNVSLGDFKGPTNLFLNCFDVENISLCYFKRYAIVEKSSWEIIIIKPQGTIFHVMTEGCV